jgi:hypothetical protein
MTKEQLAARIRCNFFANRDSLDEAFEYAHALLKDNPAAMTALYVVLNTVAKEILNVESSKETV